MSRRKKADRPLRVLLIGCGRAAQDHLKAIAYFEKRGHLALEGLVDRDESALAEALRSRPPHLPRPAAARDLEDLLEDRTFDLAVIATPPLTHASLGRKALEAGAHLIVEKPLTLDVREAEELIALAREKGRLLATGFKYRYIPGVLEIKSFIDSQALGQVLYGSVSVRWGHDQAYYDQAAWFGSWEAEGGALMNQSIHALDLLAWLMEARPLAATAVLARQSHLMEAADLVSGTLSLEGNRLLLIEGTTNTDPGWQEASFFLRLEKGTIRASFAGGNSSISVRDDQGKEYRGKLILSAVRRHLKREGRQVLRQLGNPYTFLYADMLDAIAEGRPPLAPGEAGLDALNYGLALLQAGKAGKRVPYPPQDFQLSDMAGFFD